MTIRVRIGASSDIGRARERNEDSFLVQEPLFAVADGMGGHRGGNVASSLAVKTLSSIDLSAEGLAASLEERVKQANRRVLEQGAADRELRGMGTTLTAVLADGERAYVAHVGDSRAYLLRDGNLQQLTEDHTLVQRMVREGKLSAEEAGNHPQRSILTRALGVEENLSVEQLTMDLHAGDRLILCTDGLTSMVDRENIQEILEAESDPQAASERLVDAANAAGGDDNITVIVLDFVDADTETAAPVAPHSAPARAAEATTVAAAAPRREPITEIVTLPPGMAEKAAEARQAATPVLGSPDAPAEPSQPEQPDKRRGIRWGRVVAGLAVVVVLIVGALIGVRQFLNHQWYVGVSNGRVAVYNGIPSKVLGFDLSHVEESTDISAAQAERLRPYATLGDGITANINSLPDARTLVEQIRRDVQSGVAGS